MNHRTVRHGAIDSTNAEAHRLAARGERGPLWIAAEAQTSGRGRLGRAWVSEPGNLYATLLLTVEGAPTRAGELSFVAALAVRAAVEDLLESGEGLALKWPNDVMLHGRKICGILAETLTNPTREATVAAVGIGLNLAHAPQGISYPVGSLGRTITPDAALAVLQRRFDHWLARWDNGRGFAAIRAAWFSHAIGRGEPVTVAQGDIELRGVFAGLADDGALILDTADGGRRLVHAGDVRFAALDALKATA